MVPSPQAQSYGSNQGPGGPPPPGQMGIPGGPREPGQDGKGKDGKSGFYDSYNNWQPKYIGYLKSYNHQQGYGFIACSETLKIHNSDVFIHK